MPLPSPDDAHCFMKAVPMAPGANTNTAAGFRARIAANSAWKSVVPTLKKVRSLILPL
jgi:hypothetical protein